MSEGGERMCPLCAEEMDLTDQHLKPCKCGYEICVWCWHHIIDMAEKDETEGRCPACRTPYNKEKIVGMTANTEKLASEMSVEKKLKSHKGKSKTSEGRKQLGSVRVIQRNLVYVVGLPLNFADEDLLQRKEYFGQYGKVLKVSISRTATGAIQHFANSTCSVYITYTKEEEAIRCIQSVNGFILDGRPLKACFGTTKYCHAWLRNTPCSNPDCLYLHEIGLQEDSFTKDEVISAYTRSRVQQITGATNSMQRRSGNVLPSPADENCNNCPALSGKLINKIATITNQNSACGAVVSPPNSSSGRSAALPAGASWGTRSFNHQPLSATTPCSNGSLKPDACNGLVASSAEVASTIPVPSLQTNTEKKLVYVEENITPRDKNKLENLVPAKKESKPDSIAVLKSSSISVHPMISPLNQQLYGVDTTKSPNNRSKVVDSSVKSRGPALDNISMDDTDEVMENICSDFLLIGVHNHVEQIKETVTSEAPGRSANMTNVPCVTEGLSDFGLRIPTQVTQVNLCETKDDMLSFDNQRLKDPEVSTSISQLPDILNSFHMPKLSSVSSVLNTADGSASVDLCGQVVDKKDNSIVSPNFPLKSGRQPYIRLNSVDANGVEYSNLFSSKDKRLLLGRYEGELAIGAGHMGENSIISNILSMDLDSLDESLTSPRNLAKFLGETDKSQGSFGVSGSWKIQNSNQSRFSFAREDTNQATHFGPASDFLEKNLNLCSFANDVPYSNVHLDNDKFATCNNFSFLGSTETDVFASNHPHISSNKLSVLRSQISAPPGFSAASRTVPPGFSSCELADQILGTLSGNHILDTSSFSRSQWQTPPSNNTFSNCDIEFMDPAILEVRHGTLPGGFNSPVLDVRSSHSPQLNTFGESRLQSFMQRSLPSHTNQRINELGDGFSSIADAYGVRSRVMEQTLSNNFSPFSQFTHPQPRNGIASNGQWNGWNEGPGANNLGMAELLRNERLGFNKSYGGYEDSKIRMPSSGNMYNGSYGI